MALEPVGGVRWFSRDVERKVGNGRDTLFWKDAWVANELLRDAFPYLFSLALSQDVKVAEVCFAECDRWRLLWRRELFEWEKESLLLLLGRLNGVVLREGVDRWYWKPEKEGVFSVKTCYLLLQNLMPL